MEFKDAICAYDEICRYYTEPVNGECGENCRFKFLDRNACLRSMVRDPESFEKTIAEWRAEHESSCEGRGEEEA